MFSEHKWRTGLMQHACDLANILKAFIGSNFLSIPFGFSHCGLLLGVVGMVCIAVLTAHCCLLLVTCKHKLLHHIIAAQEQHHTSDTTPTPRQTPRQTSKPRFLKTKVARLTPRT
ncbi:proton-coupled amino acid transporter 3-like [Pomacea canaliculata]|uniref:proton-coupled amino acid transporter 3-like n=1 Tax=Pomacea canaliculata TaxID=400727 RepID=UPI000D72C861|nr:proton-coupled amino acid transporter 3-like [Pomacea canaliculata]